MKYVRRVVICLLTLASLGTVILWIDSYRERVMNGPYDLITLGPTGMNKTRGQVMMTKLNYSKAFLGWHPGLDVRLPLADGKTLVVETETGLFRLWLSRRLDTISARWGSSFEAAGFGFRTQETDLASSDSTITVTTDGRFTIGYPSVKMGIIIPFWFLATFFGFYPLWVLWSGPIRRFRRRRRGLCLNCGYNLCGLPEPRCPECGTSSGPRNTLETLAPENR